VAILIPMPDSHQKDNAAVFQSKDAALVLEQDKLTDETFSRTIKELIVNKHRMNQLENNISQVMKVNASEEMANLLLDKFINI
jgi:UDP-N-acetylglucosamine:LPS N-acetylglucosamine transferase